MKAIILAGGYATRLRPLSCQKPKLLFPITGKPILEKTIETLKEIGVDEVVLAVNYLADVLETHFKDEFSGVRIKYSRETFPLGTAGPIKKAEHILKNSDPFLVFNGDVLFESNLQGLIKHHKETQAIATITLKEVEDPSRFGVVLFDHDMRVNQFIEKPSKKEAPSKFINAGIYAISPKIFDFIPPEQKCSMEREVFPKILKKKSLYSYKYYDSWFDIGEFKDFISANNYYLAKISKNKATLQKGITVNSSSKLKPPTLVCRDTIIENNVSIGPSTIIGARNIIKRNSIIESSILFDDVYIDESVCLRDCVIGDGVTIGKGAKIGRNVIISEGVNINDNIKIADNKRICSHREIKQNVLNSDNVQ